MTLTVQKIRLNGCRPGRVRPKSKCSRNLFGTTREDQTATDSWLKNELQKSCLEDRTKLESLGLDPDTGMPANDSTSRWEWTILDANSCPNMYRSRDIISKFVKLSTNSTQTPDAATSSENSGLDSVAMDCSRIATHNEPSPSSRTPKQYKQTTITDFLPKRRLLFRSRRKPFDRSSPARSSSSPVIQTQQHTTSDA